MQTLIYALYAHKQQDVQRVADGCGCVVVAIVHQEGSGSPLPGTRPAPRGGNLPTCSIIIVTSENLALELFFEIS